jgi:serine/threonine protein kinase
MSRVSVHQVLGGRYRVIKQIGEGGMSYVYLVEDLKLVGKRWAAKETKLLQPDDAVGVVAEAAMLIRLNHPNLPQIVDFIGPDAEGYIYLFMDYIEGETLAADFDRRGRSLTFDHILRLGIQLCEVLQYLHQCQPPIVYRDLKPSNVMMDVHGQIRLIDFGIARHFKPNQEEDTVCLGTVGEIRTYESRQLVKSERSWSRFMWNWPKLGKETNRPQARYDGEGQARLH